MNKAKILFILHLPPPVTGAAMVGEYIKLSDSINSKFAADYINLSTSTNLHQIGKKGKVKVLTFIKIVATVSKHLLSKNYELCYMTLTAKGVGFYKDFLIVLLLKMFRRKIIFHFHNKGVKENSDTNFKRLLYRSTFRNSKSIILAPQLYSDLASYVSSENIYFCPNGIPEMLNTNVMPKKVSQLDNDICKFLFLSNMMKEKGVFEVIEACKLISKKGISFECHFLGGWSDVSEEDFNFEVLNAKLTNKVFAHGPKYDEEKFDFLNKSDVFLLPTYYHNEAFPLVCLEAMQYNLPIISTSEGGIPEMVLNGETGFLVSQKKVEELAEKMEVLILNPDLRLKMGKAGRLLYQKHFTLSKFEQKMEEILEDAILGNPIT